jgi:hypothetical protein
MFMKNITKAGGKGKVVETSSDDTDFFNNEGNIFD